MSLSSAATLISPHHGKTPNTAPGHTQRRPSHHSVKRRASTHAHGHHAHSSAGSRRSSEGEHGRRALAAGLAMHVLEAGATNGSKDGRRKNSAEKRPLAKTSRSDTHLPRLSRTHSMTSTASRSSNTSAKDRPGPSGRVRSDSSVQVLDEDGQETGEVDAEEEGWESGEGEGAASDTQTTGGPNRSRNEDSAAMRRTKSDTHANTRKTRARQPSITGVLSSDQLVATPQEVHQLPALTQRTTGFAGAVQPVDPDIIAQLPHVDPNPIATPHPLKKSASARSLVGPVAFEALATDDGVPTEPPMAAGAGEKPHKGGPQRLRSTDGSGLPVLHGEEDAASPSYPFPQMPPPDQTRTQNSSPLAATVSPTDAPDPAAATVATTISASPESDQSQLPSQVTAPSATSTTAAPRARQASGPAGPPTLRHRYSNSSLRSIQSFRAPPHPLNSPTAYRVTSTRPGSMFGSPSKDGRRQRVPSMHQPPVPAPQVSFEVAQGQGWDGIPEEAEAPRATAGPATKSLRKNSLSSNRQISGIFAGAGAGTPSSSQTMYARPISRSASSTSQAPQKPSASRRRTALEAASAASKMSTTNDPVEYHHSLGHSSASAETCFLVSRFLPAKKVVRPKWEIENRAFEWVQDPSLAQAQNSESEQYEEDYYAQPGGGGGITRRVGLTDGDYREAHESLIRTLRELDLNPSSATPSLAAASATGGNSSGSSGSMGFGKRAMSRSYSGYSLLSHHDNSHPSSSAMAASASAAVSGQGQGSGSGSGSGLGMINGKNGGLVVTKGGFRGRTPFEMSVERCLAQRPGRLIVAKLDG